MENITKPRFVVLKIGNFLAKNTNIRKKHEKKTLWQQLRIKFGSSITVFLIFFFNYVK